jgi:predicted nuclease with TOPRIM domain
MEAANKGIASRLEDLGTRLQREAQEREELLKQKDSLLAAQAGLDSTIDEKGKRALELNEATKKLESEVQELRGQLEELHNLKNKDLELASKVSYFAATLHLHHVHHRLCVLILSVVGDWFSWPRSTIWPKGSGRRGTSHWTPPLMR